MTASPKWSNGDRVRRISDRATGTLVDPGNLGVLPDVGPKRVKTWEDGDIERTGGPAKTCKRCPDPTHSTFYCPKE